MRTGGMKHKINENTRIYWRTFKQFSEVYDYPESGYWLVHAHYYYYYCNRYQVFIFVSLSVLLHIQKLGLGTRLCFTSLFLL